MLSTSESVDGRPWGGGMAAAAFSVPHRGARFARNRPLGFVGAIIVVSFIAVAIVGPFVAPYEPGAPNLRARLEASSSEHWLGTDALGRDVFSRLIEGARLSLIVGIGAVAVSSTFATIIGIVSAFFGGWFDTVVQRFVDAMMAMPDLILLITILGIVRRIPDVNLIVAITGSIALLRIAPASRIVRSAALEVSARPFVEAASAAGATPLRIMRRHVFPLILISASIALPGAILAEASLSFLGFGPEGAVSWGQMLSADGREFFRARPGLAIYPGVAIGLTVFGINVLGDALRDVLDPRLRGGRGT